MMGNTHKNIATPANQALLLLPSLWLRDSTFLLLVEIKLKSTQNIRT